MANSKRRKQKGIEADLFQPKAEVRGTSIRQGRFPALREPKLWIALAVGVLLAGVLMTRWLSQSPLLTTATRWRLEGFAPDTAASSDWSVQPRYFAIGAWPKRVDGAPVLYTLPYEKGPPVQFIGHMIARWSSQEIRVTFEGPRTPAGLREPGSTERLRDCLLAPLGLSKLSCFRIRKAALDRHVSEIRSALQGSGAGAARDWNVRWVEVANTSIPDPERPRGIYVSANNESRTQERFILITPSGQHQAFWLDRPLSSKGQTAQALFEQAIRSQRVSDDLAPGKAWVERQLQDTRLDQVKRTGIDPSNATAQVAALAEIQALLLAKLSVDPRDYNAYFHLGGTSLMILRQASAPAANGTSDLHLDWSASAKPTLMSAIRYAQDLDPQSSRTRQLQKLWLEFNK